MKTCSFLRQHRQLLKWIAIGGAIYTTKVVLEEKNIPHCAKLGLSEAVNNTITKVGSFKKAVKDRLTSTLRDALSDAISQLQIQDLMSTNIAKAVESRPVFNAVESQFNEFLSADRTRKILTQFFRNYTDSEEFKETVAASVNSLTQHESAVRSVGKFLSQGVLQIFRRNRSWANPT